MSKKRNNYVVPHARHRMMERLSMTSSRKMEELATRAYQMGRWLRYDYRYRNGEWVERNLREYDGRIWVFGEDGALITVYNCRY